MFTSPFFIVNEVVKRSTNDNRRLASSPVKGGNDFFYLGTPNKFKNNLRTENQRLFKRIEDIEKKCQEKFNNKDLNTRTLQKNEGILVNHKISKKILLSSINLVEKYLRQNSQFYHNPNFNINGIIKKIEEIDTEDILFKSDLTFIHDKNMAKPYFKWFDDTFKLVQEFFIPYQSILNFILEGYEEESDTINIRWAFSYTEAVTRSSDNFEEIINEEIINEIKAELLNNQDSSSTNKEHFIETIREAITKIRIGQDKFRKALLVSETNYCIFTGIKNPELLIASHIKPWKEASNEERINPNNGFLLTPTFDKLFDRFLITINADGSIIWSKNRLDAETIDYLTQAYPKIKNNKLKIDDNKRLFLDHHRKTFYQKESLKNTTL